MRACHVEREKVRDLYSRSLLPQHVTLLFLVLCTLPSHHSRRSVIVPGFDSIRLDQIYSLLQTRRGGRQGWVEIRFLSGFPFPSMNRFPLCSYAEDQCQLLYTLYIFIPPCYVLGSTPPLADVSTPVSFSLSVSLSRRGVRRQRGGGTKFRRRSGPLETSEGSGSGTLCWGTCGELQHSPVDKTLVNHQGSSMGSEVHQTCVVCATPPCGWVYFCLPSAILVLFAQVVEASRNAHLASPPLFVFFFFAKQPA